MLARSRSAESGNMIFIIILAIVLVGLVTAALRNSGLEMAGIDREELIIRASQVRQHAAEIERGVSYALQNGISEGDISFAHPEAPSDYGTYGTTPEAEVFNPAGGGATWREPPSGLAFGSSAHRWEFYGSTAIPGAGTDRAELVAVLSNVSDAFCQKVNEMNELSGQPVDDATCVFTDTTGRFAPVAPPGNPFDTSPNTMNAGTFSKSPPLEACVRCGAGSGDPLHFYHVLLVR